MLWPTESAVPAKGSFLADQNSQRNAQPFNVWPNLLVFSWCERVMRKDQEHAARPRAGPVQGVGKSRTPPLEGNPLLPHRVFTSFGGSTDIYIQTIYQ